MLYFIQNTDERCKNNYVHVRCNSLFYRKKSPFFHVRCNIMMLPKNFSIFTRPVRHDYVAEKFISQKVYRQTIILAKFVTIFKANSVPQTGCRQPIILAKFVTVFKANSVSQTGCRQPIILANQILFHKRVKSLENQCSVNMQ